MGCRTCCAGTRAASHSLSVFGVFPLGTAELNRRAILSILFLVTIGTRGRGKGRASLTALSHMLPRCGNLKTPATYGR